MKQLIFQTLSRVIATIVHFSDEQTKRIISYEDSKNAVCNATLCVNICKYQDNQMIKHTNIYEWGKIHVLC